MWVFEVGEYAARNDDVRFAVLLYDCLHRRGVKKGGYRLESRVVRYLGYIDRRLDTYCFHAQFLERFYEYAVVRADVDNEFRARNFLCQCFEMPDQSRIDRGGVVIILEHSLARNDGPKLDIFTGGAEKNREREEIFLLKFLFLRIFIGKRLLAEIEELLRVALAQC